jgi:hypothetical protein
MCDYSFHSVRSRPAKAGDKLTTRNFGTGTRGFAASEDRSVAVCVLPGTELSFSGGVRCLGSGLFGWPGIGLFGWPGIGLFGWPGKVIKHTTAIFRQINKDKMSTHRDALEFPDGQIVLLTALDEGQQATLLQLPAESKAAAEAEAQKRTAYAG